VGPGGEGEEKKGKGRIVRILKTSGEKSISGVRRDRCGGHQEIDLPEPER